MASTDYPAQQVTRPDGSVHDVAFKTFWTQFQGEAVVCYTKDDAPIGHVIVVRSGGVAFDPSRWASEDGEFIADHFNRVGGKIVITNVSTVTQMLPPVGLYRRIHSETLMVSFADGRRPETRDPDRREHSRVAEVRSARTAIVASAGSCDPRAVQMRKRSCRKSIAVRRRPISP